LADLIYGMHAVAALVARAPERIELLLAQEGRQDQRMQALLTGAEQAGVAHRRVARQELDERTGGAHQGVAVQLRAGFEYREAHLADLLDRTAEPLLLVLDGITDPHNLGACLRSADAAGVTAVIAPRDRAVGLTPVVRKVACGAAEVMPFIQVTNLARTLKWLQQRGIWTVGAAGEADLCLYDHKLTGPLALVMGAEGSGLRRLTREHCDFLVKLPMAGSVSSLNVSVATGICLYEAVRQRRAATS
jgi:23S rRNA (guanosine2251-2'-O)-methyltransferase